jgi:hypothetical protein
MLQIADQFGLTHDMVKNDLQQVVRADRAFRDKQNKAIERVLLKQEQERETDRRAAALLNSGFSRMTEYSGTEQQRALEMKRSSIMQEVLNNPRFDTDEERVSEIIRQNVAFLRDIPIKDERVKTDFQVVGQSAPISDDGELNESHMQAYQYFTAMQEGGLSERTISEYAGDSYAYLAVAAELSNGSVEPRTALQTAWEQTQVPKGERVTPRTNVRDTQEQWENTREEFFDNIEPSIIASWLGAESDGKYDEVLTWQVKDAAKNSPDLDRWAKRRIQLYANTYPNMRPQAVMGLVKRDLSRWEYVMGNMVMPKDGKSLTEAMGLSDYPGTLKTNSAMLMYMRDNADLLFPEGTEQAGWWDSFKSKTGEALDTAIFEPEKITGLMVNGSTEAPVGSPFSFAQNVLMAASEKEQRIANDIRMIDVTPMSGGQVMITLYSDTDKNNMVGAPIPVASKDIGDWYKVMTKNQQFDKNLPRK